MLTRICWPTTKPVMDGTFTFVSPMFAAENRVVAAPAAVPTALIVPLSWFGAVSRLRVPPTAKPADAREVDLGVTDRARCDEGRAWCSAS